MMRPVACPEAEPAIRLALSSIELSLLAHVAFDPEALPAIRAGQRLNTIDADDSGTLRHAVPLAAVIVGLGEPAASQVGLSILYAARIVFNPVDHAA